MSDAGERSTARASARARGDDRCASADRRGEAVGQDARAPRPKRARRGDAGIDKAGRPGGQDVPVGQVRALRGQPLGNTAEAPARRGLARSGQGDAIREIGMAPGERMQRIQRERLAAIRTDR